MILLTFALSSSSIYGWGKVCWFCFQYSAFSHGGTLRFVQAIIIAPLIVSALALFTFAYTEQKVPTPLDSPSSVF
jgi:hypothetical protein